jgi:hypothetical protein
VALTRRQLVERGAVALAAGNVYSLLESLAPAVARAAAPRRLRPEQYVLDGLRVQLELGIEVLVPPLHHRVVTARLKVAGGRAPLRAAQKRLEAALARLDARYPATPAGLGVTVAWGLPYFRRLVPRLADGSRFPAYLPLDVRASRERGRRVPAVLDATRFASDDEIVLGADDVVVLFRSDEPAHIEDGERAIFGALDDLFAVTSIRSGFVGGITSSGPGVAKQMALAAGIPGADLIVDGVQMFLGFTSTQKAAMAPDRISSFETLKGFTDQWPNGAWRGGTAMHLSHLDEELELWWKEVPFADQLRAMARPGLTVPDKTYTVAEDVTRVERAADVHADLRSFGGVGHSATLQTVTRLAAETVDNYGVRRARATPIVQRADFNTLDNPFQWSAAAGEASKTPSAGVHFVAFAPTTDTFNRTRRAMDGKLGDGSATGLDVRSKQLGFNAFIRATHRQNFLVPPRARRSFPLAELVAASGRPGKAGTASSGRRD